MARKILEGTQYTFTPSTRTITINEYIPRERLVLITNVTANRVIYNFSDAQLKATSYTAGIEGNQSSTTIVLSFDTSSMLASDDLQILIDEYADTMVPAETFRDPVDKFRVSAPQSLIDTDFEYGPQPTKWENVATVRYRPFTYPDPIALTPITSMVMPTGDRRVTITCPGHGFPAGTPIMVLDTYLSIANGNYFVDEATPDTLTYTASSVNKTSITNILDLNKTLVFSADQFRDAQIGGAPTVTYDGKEITITTTIPHGLSIGNEVVIFGITGTDAPNGSYYITSIPSSDTFKFYAKTAPSGVLDSSVAVVYVVLQTQFVHRPYDGGMLFSTNSLSNFHQATRQTRKYFRYQSGKGIQMSSGTVLKPSLQIDSITSDGNTVTVQTKEKHNLAPGVTIIVSGANETAYNGTYQVNDVIDYNTFTYTIVAPPGLVSPASGNYIVSVATWYGSNTKVGMFDDQNGIFFKFDGTHLSVVRRTSTYQISGRITATHGSCTVTQTNEAFPTFFARQLEVGDSIVIRGQSYRVLDIDSDTSLTITPSYRGATTEYASISKTIDIEWPQSEWNLDKMDGTGPSGFNIDLTKMQMFYLDYTWYGAGYIRWGLRGSNGDITYVHKIANNNVNTEAYMRSGNLPARYETDTNPPVTKVTSSIVPTDTTINVVDTEEFPNVGTLLIRNGDFYEYVNYESKTATSFQGLTRAKSGVKNIPVTIAVGENIGTVLSTDNIQVGMRVGSTDFPENTYISKIVNSSTLQFSKSAINANPTIDIAPMGSPVALTFSYSATNPITVELAYPEYASSLSHWGTAIIMDGGFDPDKSNLFAYRQKNTVNVPVGQRRALLSMRVAPSVDSGLGGPFGAREIINRMQMLPQTLETYTVQTGAKLYVEAVLNGHLLDDITTWINPATSKGAIPRGSLAEIADFAGLSSRIREGENYIGYVPEASGDILDLSAINELGNSVLGGGGTTTDSALYPDGPDTLTIMVTNEGDSAIDAYCRVTWKEAQS